MSITTCEDVFHQLVKAQEDAHDGVRTHESDGIATPERRQSDGRAAPERRQSGGRATAERRQSDGIATPERRQSDGRAAPERRQSGGRATPERHQIDGRATPERRQSGARAAAKRRQSDARATPERRQSGLWTKPPEGALCFARRAECSGSLDDCRDGALEGHFPPGPLPSGALEADAAAHWMIVGKGPLRASSLRGP
ncbi:Protein FAM83H [Liparis tanakae]|uniref:Protein FAM83H n=1 Tax=Liparis tanakae TaxID=230148 RepID=A0A4Z2E0E4_9TELE|nr:Protein FAM83H [Liparis tanakae]